MSFGCWSTSYKSKVMRINMDNLSKSAKKKCSVRLPFSKVQTIPTSLHVYSYSHVLSDIYSSLFNVFLFISLRRLLSQTHFLLTQVWVRQHVRAAIIPISLQFLLVAFSSLLFSANKLKGHSKNLIK